MSNISKTVLNIRLEFLTLPNLLINTTSLTEGMRVYFEAKGIELRM